MDLTANWEWSSRSQVPSLRGRVGCKLCSIPIWVQVWGKTTTRCLKHKSSMSGIQVLSRMAIYTRCRGGTIWKRARNRVIWQGWSTRGIGLICPLLWMSMQLIVRMRSRDREDLMICKETLAIICCMRADTKFIKTNSHCTRKKFHWKSNTIKRSRFKEISLLTQLLIEMSRKLMQGLVKYLTSFINKSNHILRKSTKIRL